MAKFVEKLKNRFQKKNPNNESKVFDYYRIVIQWLYDFTLKKYILY